MFDFLRERCPACGKRGLRIYGDRAIAEGREQGMMVTPSFSWRRCPHCNAHFKNPVREDELIPVTAAEFSTHADTD